MTVWVVRTGSRSEYEDIAFDNGLVVISFGLRQDVSGFSGYQALRDHLHRGAQYEYDSAQQAASAASQLLQFATEITIDDMVVSPRTHIRMVAVGRVTGDYAYHSAGPAAGFHTRAVEWRATDIPRANFPQDLLDSWGYPRTVFKPRVPDDAEVRIERVVQAHSNGGMVVESDEAAEFPGESSDSRSMRERNLDNIIRLLQRKFSGDGGERLEDLVHRILEASGYTALRTRRGPDGGIDVVAGKGDMGFGIPRICVQVKSGHSPVGLPDYDRLQGNVQGFGADHGLLVSLGGFTRPVHNANESSYFKIRLWGPYELAQRVLDSYDGLPVEMQAAIPLETMRVLQQTQLDA